MRDLIRGSLPGRVAAALAPHVPAGSSILVGLSGGVDSVVLLHLLATLAPLHSWKLSALHVHHGISPNADAWAAFCAKLCELRAIPLQIERVDIAPLRAKGIEAAARELRHAALFRQPVDFIALAHHQDDQAETLLLQLLRGAGVKGVAAMPPVREALSGPVLLRPLLDTSRIELEEYAARHALDWVEDESNTDERYPRNFLRHRVFPLLEQHFPACRTTLARAAGHFAEADALLDSLAELDAQQAFDGNTLDVTRLSELDKARAKNLLRWFLLQRGALMPENPRLEEMLRQLSAAREDAQVCVAWGDWEIRRYRGRAHVCSRQNEPAPGFSVLWRGEERLLLPGGELRFVHCRGEGASAAKLASAPVTVRLRRGEESLRPDGARPTRSLRYLFQDSGIPPWQRAGWPLLYCGETLIAVPEIGVEAAWRAAPDEAGVVPRWVRD
ncbi:MAG TPA: tRNA lysidine(34) synthetase TilS [Gallionellaceae bacterium]